MCLREVKQKGILAGGARAQFDAHTHSVFGEELLGIWVPGKWRCLAQKFRLWSANTEGCRR